MIKTMMVAAVLAVCTVGAAQAQDRGLAQGAQGRPHDGNFAEKMLLRRHHMTRMQYNAMRRQAAMRRHHMMMMHRHA